MGGMVAGAAVGLYRWMSSSSKTTRTSEELADKIEKIYDEDDNGDSASGRNEDDFEFVEWEQYEEKPAARKTREASGAASGAAQNASPSASTARRSRRATRPPTRKPPSSLPEQPQQQQQQQQQQEENNVNQNNNEVGWTDGRDGLFFSLPPHTFVGVKIEFSIIIIIIIIFF